MNIGLVAARRVLHTFWRLLLPGFAWNLLSALALQGSVLLTGVALARMLGLESFGLYALLVGTVMTVAGVAQGGMGLVSTKFVGEWQLTQPQRVARLLLLCSRLTLWTGVVAAAALTVLAPLVAHDLLGKPLVEPYMRWVAIAVLFHVMSASPYGALQGFGAFRRASQAGAIAGALHLVSACIGAMLADLPGALGGFAFASLARWLCFRQALVATLSEHAIAQATRIEREDWQLAWTFALPASLASLVTLPCLWGVTALVARQPNGLAWVALFAVGHQIKQAVLQLPVLLNSVSFSVLSRLRGLGKSTQHRHVFWTNMTVGIGFTVLIVTILALLADQVLGLYGAGFVEGRMTLLILLLAVIPEMAGISAYQLVQSSGRMWRSLLLIVGPRDLLYLGLAAALLPMWGLPGAAWAYLLAHLFGCTATLFFGRVGKTRPSHAEAMP